MKAYHLADRNNGIFETFTAATDKEAQTYLEKYIAEKYEIYGDKLNNEEGNSLDNIKDFHFLLDDQENEI